MIRFLTIVICVLVGALSATAQGTDDPMLEMYRKNGVLDMSQAPVLSDTQRKPSWTIKHWISADRLHADCATAIEYMNEKVESKTRNGRTNHIMDYMRSCRTAVERARSLVEPQAIKWCIYKDSDPRLSTLCDEWTLHGESYMRTIQSGVDSTMKRFQSMTNGAYDHMW